jgi:hypothetical protein
VKGHSLDESDDPLVSAAAFELAQILARKGIAADEIRITFSSTSKALEPKTVNIRLFSFTDLTDSPDTLPDFDGLNGVFALLDLDEEEGAFLG